MRVLVQDCDIQGPRLTSSHRHTKPIPINEEIPSERNLAEWLLHIGWTRQYQHQWVRKAETLYCQNLHPHHSSIKSGGNSTLRFSLGVKGLDTSSTPTFKTSTWEMGPQNTQLLKLLGTYIHETHKTIAKKQFFMGPWGLTMAILPGLKEERADRNAHLPVFPRKRSIYIF